MLILVFYEMMLILVFYEMKIQLHHWTFSSPSAQHLNPPFHHQTYVVPYGTIRLMVQKSGDHHLIWYIPLWDYLPGFIHPRWCRISEPSTVLSVQIAIWTFKFYKPFCQLPVLENLTTKVHIHPHKTRRNAMANHFDFL